MIRHLFVWLHRWFGLAMALFLVIEGLTGSMLAFNAQLTRLFNPRLFVASPPSGARPLDPASLAVRVRELVPQARMAVFRPSARGSGRAALRGGNRSGDRQAL